MDVIKKIGFAELQGGTEVFKYDEFIFEEFKPKEFYFEEFKIEEFEVESFMELLN